MLFAIAIVVSAIVITGGESASPTPTAPPVATAGAAPSREPTRVSATSTSIPAVATATVSPTRNARGGKRATPSQAPFATVTPIVVAQAPPPVRLRIPAIGLDTVVQWVGVDAEGRLAVPSNYTDVGWYQEGPAPGTPGNAVIDGHLDSTTGPAVFYRLNELQPGDEIFTVSETGQEYRFVVTTSEVYPVSDAPLDKIFGPADLPKLNLITCDGAFDRAIRQYDMRLVVYSQLVASP